MYPVSPHVNESGLRAEWFTRKAYIYGPDGRVISSVGNRFGRSLPGLQFRGDGFVWIRSNQYSTQLINAGDAGSFDFYWQHVTDSAYIFGTPASSPFSYGYLVPMTGGLQIRIYRRSVQGTGGFDGQHFFPGLYDFSYPRLIGMNTLLVDPVTKECEVSLYLDGVLIDTLTAFGQTQEPVIASCTTINAYGNGSNAADGFMADHREFACDYKYVAGRNHMPTGHERRWFTFEGTSTTTVWDVSGNGNHAEFINANVATVRSVNPNAQYSLLNEYGYNDSTGDIIPGVIPFNNTAADGSTLEHKGAVRHELQMVDSHCLSLDGIAYVEFPTTVNLVINDRLIMPFATNGSLFTGYMFHEGAGNCLDRCFFSSGKLVIYPVNGHSDCVEGDLYASAGCQATVVTGSDGLWNFLELRREYYLGEDSLRYYINGQPIGLAIKAAGNMPSIRYVGIRNTEASDHFTGMIAGITVDGEPAIPFAEGSGTTIEAFSSNGSTVVGNILAGSGTNWGSQDVYHYNATRKAHLSKAFPSSTETKVKFPDCPLVRKAGIDPDVQYSAADLSALTLGELFVQEKSDSIEKLCLFRTVNPGVSGRATNYTS